MEASKWTGEYISEVERLALVASGDPLVYPPEEKIGIVTVDSFPALGRLTALRFLEWVQENPEGVIALPTGKTPEYFIKEVGRFRDGWKSREIRKELEAGGVDPGLGCDLRGLVFVQIDEFYPIDSRQHNSFHHYVNAFYIQGFGLDPRRAMLIDGERIGLPAGASLKEVWPEDAVDLSLRFRMGKSPLERLQKRTIEAVDQWCGELEDRVRDLGGIGFFLGGIGPDGHIGFNVSGSAHHSVTRLTQVNYPTQAAAASDLGGIEVARKRQVITLGLGTIAYNPACVALIIAAGEAKARIVAESVQNPPNVLYPATALQQLAGSRFYLTRGAAAGLTRRRFEAFRQQASHSPAEVERVVVDLALQRGKSLESLEGGDFAADPFSAELLRRKDAGLEGIVREVAERIRNKIRDGTEIRKDAVFLHTEPHHDDIMLGILPYVVRHIREHSTQHFFATLTSGFTAVTNAFMLRQLQAARGYLETPAFASLRVEGYFSGSSPVHRNRDVWQYLDGVAAVSEDQRRDGECRRLIRNMIEVYGDPEPASLRRRVEELIRYFQTRYPGQKDDPEVQTLKGMCREWEAECLWGYFGWDPGHVRHLRLPFYTGDPFTEEPTLERDVRPIIELLGEVRPDVVTLALDPEASGPDTHYKVLQAITAALRIYEQESGRHDLSILGYRNVWYRFHPSEADLAVPVSLNMFSLQSSAFMNTFISQREASFPSHEHDGPFCELAQAIQVKQYRMIKTCLGRAFFHEHPSALIRATRGLVFLKRMSLKDLYQHSRELQRRTENR